MVGKIYRIPTKRGYAKTRVDKGKAWGDIYGKYKCTKCRQPFKEGQLYTPDGAKKFMHVDCKHPKQNPD